MKKYFPIIEPYYLGQILSRTAREILMPNYQLMPMKAGLARTRSYAFETLATAEDSVRESLAELVPNADFVATHQVLDEKQVPIDGFWKNEPFVIGDGSGGLLFDPNRTVILIDAFDGSLGFMQGVDRKLPFAMNLAFIEDGQTKIACSYQPLSGAFLYVDNGAVDKKRLSLNGAFGGHYTAPGSNNKDRVSSSKHDLYHVGSSDGSDYGLPALLYADNRLVESTYVSTCAASSVEDLIGTLKERRQVDVTMQAYVSCETVLPTRHLALAHLVTKAGGAICDLQGYHCNPLTAPRLGVVYGATEKKAFQAMAYALRFANVDLR